MKIPWKGVAERGVNSASLLGRWNRGIRRNPPSKGATLALTLVIMASTLETIIGSQPDGGNHSPFSIAEENEAVTKKEIIRVISEKVDLTQAETKLVVQMTFDAIVETLVEDGRIELRNFGVFEVKKRAPRKARNPKTNEDVMVPEKLVVTFKPGKEMEERVRHLGELKRRREQAVS